MFSLREYMLQVLICVLFEDKEYIVHVFDMKGGVVKKTHQKSFEDKKKLLAYIDELSLEHQLYYICLFLESANQGLIPTNNKEKLAKFDLDTKAVQTLSLSNAQIYSSKEEIAAYKELFRACGRLDLIYSPFALLYYCISTKIKHPKKAQNLPISLYIYKHNAYIALIICEGQKILFGSFTNLNASNESPPSEAEENKEVESKEEKPQELAQEQNGDTQTDEIEETNVAKELDELIDKNTDEVKQEENNEVDLSTFGSYMDMCIYLFSNIEEFYNNPIYNGNFISELIIFDNDEMNDAAMDYIEAEIFLRPSIIQVDTFELMRELMCLELKI